MIYRDEQLERRVCAAICQSSGVKAREIAALLKLDRNTVNHILYASPLLKELCWQDRDYRWHGIIRQTRPHSGLFEFSGYYGYGASMTRGACYTPSAIVGNRWCDSSGICSI